MTQANHDLFRARVEYTKEIRENAHVKVSEEKIEQLKNMKKRYFHSPEPTKKGYKFLKRQSPGIVNTSPRLDGGENHEADETSQ